MESQLGKDVEALHLIQGKTLLCRLCHKEGKASELIHGHDIHFIETGSSTSIVTLFDILRKITNLPFDSEELPYEFCSKCCKQLLKHHLFSLNCIEQEEQLQNFINPLTQHKLDCLNVKSEPDVESKSYYLFAFNPIEESTKVNPKKKQAKSKTEVENKSQLVFDPMNKSTKRKSTKGDNDVTLPVSGGRCDFCGRTCKKRDILRHHRYVCKKRDKRVLPDPDVTFVCDICNNTFYTKGRIHSHMKVVHAAYTEPCEICGKLFKTSKQLQVHLKVHSDSREKKFGFPCEFCGWMLGTRQTLKQHHFVCKERDKDVLPDPDITFICDLCNATFYNKGRMRYHMKTVHIPSTVPCKICGKKFKTSKQLLSHSMVHSNQRNYKCRYCHNSFKTSNGLICHERIHTGETPFPCSECDLSFLSASRRKAHFLSKHCEKSAACNICLSKFPSNSRVRQHMKKVHFKETNKPNKPKIVALTKVEDNRVTIKPIKKYISLKINKIVQK